MLTEIIDLGMLLAAVDVKQAIVRAMIDDRPLRLGHVRWGACKEQHRREHATDQVLALQPASIHRRRAPPKAVKITNPERIAVNQSRSEDGQLGGI